MLSELRIQKISCCVGGFVHNTPPLTSKYRKTVTPVELHQCSPTFYENCENNNIIENNIISPIFRGIEHIELGLF